MNERLTIPNAELRATLDERRIPEDPPSVRSEAQRDRDRILYSSALLRLGHVTQVAAPELGHIFHSRLTHSIKVAQVARGLAQCQKKLATKGKLDPGVVELVDCLDEDATEAAALAHDLGHPPFGHLAEKALQDNSQHATFEGNPQSFRIVTRLALRSEKSPGLNLTRRTLNGLLKYPWLREEEPEIRMEKWGAYTDGDDKVFHWVRRGFPEGERSLEACLMDWADDVTYAVHDMDDFFRAGLIPLEHLTDPGSLELRRFQAYLRNKFEGEESERLAETAERTFGGLISSIRVPFAGRTDERVNLRRVGSELIGLYVAAPQMRDIGEGKVEITINREVADQVKVLKQLTWCYVIERPTLSVIQRGQRQVIETLFAMYREAIAAKEAHVLPQPFAEWLPRAKGPASRERVAIDLIASMTEASAAELYRQRTGVSAGSVLVGATGPV